MQKNKKNNYKKQLFEEGKIVMQICRLDNTWNKRDSELLSHNTFYFYDGNVYLNTKE
jgi:hypothetical protein